MKVKKTTMTVLDWDDAINNAKSLGVITKEEAVRITEYMSYELDTDTWGLYIGDITEENEMDGNVDTFKRFYDLYSEHKIESGEEFERIMFDCSVWN